MTAALVCGCKHAPRRNVAAVFDDIRKDLFAGNVDTAQREAAQARTEFATAGGDWSTKFLLLQAKALTYQGLSPQVISLLNCDGSFAASGDAAIEQKLLCSVAHIRLNEIDRSQAELHSAQQLAAAENPALLAEAAQTEGLIDRHLNQLADAHAAFERSRTLALQNHDTFLATSDLLNLGFLALQMEHYDEASALFKEATDLAKPIGDRTVMEAALGNLGVAYYYLGDYEKALATFLQAERESKEIGTTSAQIDWMWDAGSSNYKLGNLEEAQSYLEQALAAARAIDERETVAGIDTQLASLFYEQGQWSKAKTYGDAALQAAQSTGNKAAELDPRFVQALLAIHDGDAHAEQAMIQLYAASSESPSLRWQIENALANLYRSRRQPQQAERWYRTSIQTFEKQRASLAEVELQLPFFANGDALYRDYAEFLIAAHRNDEALQLLDLGRARTLEEGLGLSNRNAIASRPRAANFTTTAGKLDAVILFYSLGPEKSYLWAVTRQDSELFALPKQSEIESLVSRYQRDILKATDPQRSSNDAATALYEKLVQPAQALVPHDARVYVIPDGALNSLNFETLLAPGANGPHYWIEDVTVTVTDSIGLLGGATKPATGPAANEARSLLLIGNPVSSNAESGAADYEKLPNAAAEVSEVQKHFAAGSETVLTQAQAVPAAYAESSPQQFAYIHFVAHGTASRLSPLDSAVVLSPAPGHPEDTKLYARDIVRAPLHAKLVTISACYGSGLRAYAGEGLVGLAWAFLRAGAHNVIGALWEANDASTPMLMDRLYSELEAGKAPDAALRAAKLSLVRSSGVYRKPVYWGAFQLYAGS